MVVWPPVSDSRADSPELVTPPPSYAQLAGGHALSSRENAISGRENASQQIQAASQLVQSQTSSSFQSYQESSFSSWQQTAVQTAASSSFQQTAVQTASNNSASAANSLSMAVQDLDAVSNAALQSPVNKRQKINQSTSKYTRDSLLELDAQITDIQNQFEAELENLLRIAGTPREGGAYAVNPTKRHLNAYSRPNATELLAKGF